MKAHTLRVATFNVHFGKHTGKIAEAIRKNKHLKKCDVFFLQEMESYHKEALSRTEQLARKLHMHFVYTPARTIGKRGSHGLAIISKHPLKKPLVLQLPRFRLLLRTRSRIALAASIQFHKTSLLLCNIHLDTRLNTKPRITQLDYALQELEKLGDNNIILGGDFNTIPLLLAGRVIPVFYANQRKKVHAHMLQRGYRYYCELKEYTFRKSFVSMQLDHIYTKTFPVTDYGVETTVRVSDHKPLWADLQIK